MGVRDLDAEPLADRLTVAAVRLVRWLKAADSAPRLTEAQASALAVIACSGGISPSDLAALERVKRPTVTRTVNELAEMGFVARDSDPADGRGVVLRATGIGLRVLAEGQARRTRPLGQALDALSAEERAELSRAADLIEQVLRDAGLARSASP